MKSHNNQIFDWFLDWSMPINKYQWQECKKKIKNGNIKKKLKIIFLKIKEVTLTVLIFFKVMLNKIHQKITNN